MKNYLDVVYGVDTHPHTAYPGQLAAHLCDRFSIRSGARLLDAGCGRGDFTRAFADRGVVVQGLDAARSESRLLEGVSVSYADFSSEPFPLTSNAYDVVFSKSVLEHLPDPDYYLEECMRVLKPGGRLILLTPDWPTQHDIFYDDPTHERPYTRVAICNILKLSGFDNVHAHHFYQVPALWRHPWLKPVAWLLQLLVPVRWKIRNHFIRFSIELMVLGTGVKP